MAAAAVAAVAAVAAAVEAVAAARGGGGRGGMSNTGHKYSLTFSAQALNLFNDIDYGTPSGSVIPTFDSTTGPTARATSLANRPALPAESSRHRFGGAAHLLPGRILVLM